MSLNSYCNISMVGSEFRVNNMKARIHPDLYQRFQLVVKVCGILSSAF